MQKYTLEQTKLLPGLFTLSLRLVIGWTYFSAFWRRVVLENKLIPDETGYIGAKFNHFLPNALGIKPMIEHLVLNPDKLYIAMVAFTYIEAIVGLLLILGLFTRLMSFGVIMLAMGILLGSGWIGTTCLDEWQIGVLGVAGGFTLLLSGSSNYSLDYLILKTKNKFSKSRFFRKFASGSFSLSFKNLKIVTALGAVLIFGLTLYTNQYFHGGVYGTLHNKSVKPKLELTAGKITRDIIHVNAYRVEGADVYGSFVINVVLKNSKDEIIENFDATYFNNDALFKIENIYVAKIKPGPHSLVLPLGAKANLSFKVNMSNLMEGEKYKLQFIDVSGLTWDVPVN